MNEAEMRKLLKAIIEQTRRVVKPEQDDRLDRIDKLASDALLRLDS